ncbi:hypothetical protein [Paucidesulfovibrio longus]|uniref:hypothetical protein n=1 Tax=Paucidesulfovibrio longus TaxID=889 RepID=UPI0003B75B44|nr:hypothetical protein [Paucidesulfovibrio longus]
MNDSEKALVRDVLGWYRKDLGLPSLGLKRDMLRFAPPLSEELLEADPDPGIRLGGSKLRRAALYSAVGALALALVLFLWAGWFNPGVALFTALCIGLLYFFPLLPSILPDREIVIRYGPRAEQELARALALAYLNRPAPREAIHALLDALLFPLLLSYQEGLAYWFTREYFRARGRDGFDPSAAPLRGRIACDLVSLAARLSKGRLPRLLLLYG